MKKEMFMKRSMIKVDYEWAFNEVISSHDFNGASPAWVKSFVEGWRDGFLEGYILGSVESTIKLIYGLRHEGIPSEKIEQLLGVSKDVINMVRNDDVATE
jgi:hypothetical protein